MMNNSMNSLANQFLIAMPNLDDPIFYRTVTYICEHTEKGAMGIIINRPMHILLGDIFQQMAIESDDPLLNQQPIFAGGPVGPEQGFILHEPSATAWQSTFQTSKEVAVTTSKDILIDMAAGKGPQKSFISLGYAGWEAGQLEEELKQNCWINMPADAKILFEKPIEERWNAAVATIGIDLSHLSNDIGHA